MPKISTNKDHFYQLLGVDLTTQQLEDLTFDFGIEAEEYEELENGKTISKISFEIAANRPDLLCIEALTHSLKMYLGKAQQTQYKLMAAKERIIVKAATKQVRPFVVGAILRNVELNNQGYLSFIEFQDKLHQNYCRKRTLVSIGTHDLDTIKGPFIYDAKAPKDIVFKALKQTETMNAEQLFEKLDNDLYLKQYLHIIRNSDVYPVIYDQNNVVLSLPPIINGDHSKMSPNTKNILIEVTAKDKQRALNILNCLVSNFCQYNKVNEIEAIEIFYEQSNELEITPIITDRILTTNLNYINRTLGIIINQQQAIELLIKMGIKSNIGEELNSLNVVVPFYRTDILQECDVAEEIGIAYGYNNIQMPLPTASTIGGEFILNKLSDMIREEVAMCGFVECLNFVLCSIKEQTELLNRPQNDQIVQINNSKMIEFQCARTTLIPGILKILKTNCKSKLPIQLFEVADIVVKGIKSQIDGYRPSEGQIGAVNRRNLCAIHSDNSSSGLEIIHGLLDQLMVKLRVKNDQENGYYLEKSNDPLFFPGLQAQILYKQKSIGVMGVIHPKVLGNIDWHFPAALIEIDVQVLLNDF